MMMKYISIYDDDTQHLDPSFIIIPATWDATTSYHSGTALAPEAIYKAAYQLDLEHPALGPFYKKGIAALPLNPSLKELNDNTRKLYETLINKRLINKKLINEQHTKKSQDHNTLQQEIHTACEDMLKNLSLNIETQLNQKKTCILLGGDHSVSLAYLKSLTNYYDSFGILQIDAHMDLRNAYQGLTYSHASVMYNALQLNEISTLTQVGIRDYCEEEFELSKSDARIHSFFDYHIKDTLFSGESWKDQCKNIIKTLPQNVYISCDIDGLSPDHCPNTGTPVPGGLSFDQLMTLIACLSQSGRHIIGADLVEVAPGQLNDWDANVGARILYQLFGFMNHSKVVNR